MAQFMGDVCARVGEYNDQQGNTKARYLKVGSWYQDDQGRISIKLLAMPIAPDPKTGVGSWLSLFHKQDEQQAGNDQFNRQQPQQRQQQQNRPPAPPRPSSRPPAGEDEVPF